MTTGRKNYHFRIYYLVNDSDIIKLIAEKFHSYVSVNYESKITTDEEGAELIIELERRKFIKIRNKFNEKR